MPHQGILYIIITLVREQNVKPAINSNGVPGSSVHIMKGECRYVYIYT